MARRSWPVRRRASSCRVRARSVRRSRLIRASSAQAPTRGSQDVRLIARPAKLRAASASSGASDGRPTNAGYDTASTVQANARRPITMALARARPSAGNPTGPRGQPPAA
jgi:hypothetical protein